MGLKRAVFAAAAGNETIITTVLAAVFVEQFQQLLLTLLPINTLFIFRVTARIADAFIIDGERGLFAVLGVFELLGGSGTLV